VSLFLAGPFSAPAQAATIIYEVAFVSQDIWQYTYTITNTGSVAGNIRLFDILFDPEIYDEASLTVASSPAIAAGWDQQLLGSGVAQPAAYDVLAIGGGIANKESASGFAVRFRWLPGNQVTPSAQAFRIYDPDTFQVLETGTTSVVPLPASFWLMGQAFAVVAFRMQRRLRHRGC
jgi:hypothetical protein